MTRDSVVAMLGASAGIAGLMLVFLGVVISTFQSYGGASSPNVLRRYRRSALFVLGSFSLSLVTVAMAITWLAWSHPLSGLYWIVFGSFLLQVLTLFGSAVFVSLQVLWR